MKFSKDNLLYNNYSWPQVASTEAIFPSRKSFDRSNGWQVINLINFSNRGLENDKEILGRGHLIEDLLLCRLPLQHCSEVSVCNWLFQQKLSTNH